MNHSLTVSPTGFVQCSECRLAGQYRASNLDKVAEHFNTSLVAVGWADTCEGVKKQLDKAYGKYPKPEVITVTWNYMEQL